MSGGSGGGGGGGSGSGGFGGYSTRLNFIIPQEMTSVTLEVGLDGAVIIVGAGKYELRRIKKETA
jgi:hypothetical protein